LSKHFQRKLDLPEFDDGFSDLDAKVSSNQITAALAGLSAKEKEELVVWKLLSWAYNIMDDFVRKIYFYASYNDCRIVGVERKTYEVDGRCIAASLQNINQGLGDLNNRMLSAEKKVHVSATRCEMQEALILMRLMQVQTQLSLQKLLDNQQHLWEGMQYLMCNMQRNATSIALVNERYSPEASLPHATITEAADANAVVQQQSSPQESIFQSPMPVSRNDDAVLPPLDVPQSVSNKSPASIWQMWFIDRLYMNTPDHRQAQASRKYLDDNKKKEYVKTLNKSYNALKSFCECICLFLLCPLPPLPSPFNKRRDTTSGDASVVSVIVA
jgi:hypothetical protein